MILHQPGRARELQDRKVIGETLASKASKERRGSPACPAAQLWRPSSVRPKETWGSLAFLAFRGTLGLQGPRG